MSDHDGGQFAALTAALHDFEAKVSNMRTNIKEEDNVDDAVEPAERVRHHLVEWRRFHDTHLRMRGARCRVVAWRARAGA